MPSSFVGILLFVACITPGLLLLLVREVRLPQREASPLRETAVLLLGGVFCDLMALLVFAIIRAWAPEVTPDVSRLVQADLGYLRQEYVPIGAWAIAMLLLACLIGVFVGAFGPVLAQPLRRFVRIQHLSAWHLMLQARPDTDVYCGCNLDDGSWLGGYLYSASTSTEETADRDLVLTGKLTFRPKGAEAVTLDEEVAIVSARNIRFLTVSYLERQPIQPPKAAYEEMGHKSLEVVVDGPVPADASRRSS